MGIYKSGRPYKYYPGTGEGTPPPHSPGEYRIRNEQQMIVYIGETCDLARRAYEHMRTGKLPSGHGTRSSFEYMIADGRSTSRTRREHERVKIKEHDPEMNRSRGGEGRPAGK